MKSLKYLILLFLFSIPVFTEAQVSFTPVPGQNCCYEVYVVPIGSGFSCFKVNTDYNNLHQTYIISSEPYNDYFTDPATVPPQTTILIWKTYNNVLSYSAGRVCFNNSSNTNEFSIEISWSTNYGATFSNSSIVDIVCEPSGCETAVPNFTMKDTVCSIDSIKIDGSSSRFETDYRISVQKLGGSVPEISEWLSGEAGIFDLKTWYQGKGSVFECGNYYKIKFGVKNSCTDLVETDKLLFIKCCDTCSGMIKAPPTLYYTVGNYPVIPKVSVSNFTGTGEYSWQLIPDNPAQCPGGSGTLTGNGPFNITLNQRINANCTYTLKIWRGDCVAQTPVKLIPCPCD